MVGVCRHSFDSEKDKRFQRADVSIAVPDVFHRVVLEFPGGNAVLFLLDLGFDGFYCGIVEIYVGYRGEQRLFHKRVSGLGGLSLTGGAG